MRQIAHLCEQQCEDQQYSGEQGAVHGAHFNQVSGERQCNPFESYSLCYSLSRVSEEVNDQVRVMVRMSTSLVMFGGSGE